MREIATNKPGYYDNFKWENIQKSLNELIADVKKETGASDEEISLALGVCAQRFMEVNFLKGEKTHG